MVTDLLTGQVSLMFNSMPSVLPQVRAGKLEGIAVGSADPGRAGNAHCGRIKSGRIRIDG
jgi:hypothetical protein